MLQKSGPWLRTDLPRYQAQKPTWRVLYGATVERLAVQETTQRPYLRDGVVSVQDAQGRTVTIQAPIIRIDRVN